MRRIGVLLKLQGKHAIDKDANEQIGDIVVVARLVKSEAPSLQLKIQYELFSEANWQEMKLIRGGLWILDETTRPFMIFILKFFNHFQNHGGDFQRAQDTIIL